MMQRRFTYVTLDFTVHKFCAGVRVAASPHTDAQHDQGGGVVLHMPGAHDAGGPGSHCGFRSVHPTV